MEKQHVHSIAELTTKVVIFHQVVLSIPCVNVVYMYMLQEQLELQIELYGC